MGATPTSSLATLRPDLASMEEFDVLADAEGFIGQRVLPKLDVAVQAGSFGRIPLKELLKRRETRRAPRSGYSRGNWKFDTDSFATEEHGVEEVIDDREAKMYANYFDAEVKARNRAMREIMVGTEEAVSAALFNTDTYTGATLTTAVSTPWSMAATATPVADVEGAVLKIYENTGLWANALIISRLLYRKLRNVAEIIDRSKAQGFMDVRKGAITAQELSVVFDLPYIIVAGGTKDTAAEGQSANLSGIWSESMAMVARIATSDDVSEPCLGRIFNWTGDGGVDGVVESYRDETRRGDVIRVRNDRQIKVMYTACGHLLTNTHA